MRFENDSLSVCSWADEPKTQHEKRNIIENEGKKSRHKTIPFYMKKQFGEQVCTHVERSLHKAQSHQVEFNWLQLFNVVFSSLQRLPLFYSQFPLAKHRMVSLSAHLHNLFFAVFTTNSVRSRHVENSLAILNYFHSNLFSFACMCWKSQQMRIQWSAEQSTIWSASQRRKNEIAERRRKNTEHRPKIFQFPLQLLLANLPISANVQFVPVCVSVFAFCVHTNGKRKSEPKHRKQTIKARTQETIMEQVNGGSSNTEKKYINLFSDEATRRMKKK